MLISAVNILRRDHEQSTTLMAQQGWRPLMDLPTQWQQRWGLPHENNNGEGPFCLSTIFLSM